MATFIVTNTFDSGSGSLRQAISDANNTLGADTIVFEPSLSGSTINLTPGETEPFITEDLTIDGDIDNDGKADININKDNSLRAGRIFTIGNTRSLISVTIDGLVISGGSTFEDDGGGIFNTGNLTLNNSSVINNSAGGSGGGIFNTGNLTLKNSSVINNVADDAGGGIFNTENLTLNNSSVIGNFAQSFGITRITTGGGGIFNSKNLTLNNSTISNNTTERSSNGGGILDLGFRVTINNSTVSNNTATFTGGGIFSESILSLFSTIVANNGGFSFSGRVINLRDLSFDRLSAQNNLFGDSALINIEGNNIIGVDPLLGELQDNGGGTLTRALLPGSPAVDMGSNVRSFLTDQRGLPRTSGAGTDIGAFEVQQIPTVTIEATDASAAEAGQALGVFTISRSGVTTNALTVSYTIGGTATNADFTPALSGTATIPATQSSTTITIVPVDDTIDEPDENVTLTLGASTDYTIGSPNNATVTISDNDLAPTISIGTATVTEGSIATFTATLSSASGQAVTTNFATNTATANASDFTARTGTITFAPGVTSQTITVQTTNDTIDENDETFTVVLSNPSNATIGTGTSTATIQDNDNAPTLSIGTATVTEGSIATFTASLSSVSGQTVTANFATVNGTADGSDFIPNSGSIIFAPGVTTQTVTVSTINDTINEPTEALAVSLSNPTNVTIGIDTGTITILDNDAPPRSDTNDDTVFGTPDNDRIDAQGGDDIIFGDLGNDSIFGNNGDDSIDGGLGNDTIRGGVGKDTLTGGSNSQFERDVLDGGLGNDVFILANSSGDFYRLNGNNDFATIVSFNSGDRVAVANTSTITLSNVVTPTRGVGIFSEGDLIAVVQGNISIPTVQSSVINFS